MQLLIPFCTHFLEVFRQPETLALVAGSEPGAIDALRNAGHPFVDKSSKCLSVLK